MTDQRRLADFIRGFAVAAGISYSAAQLYWEMRSRYMPAKVREELENRGFEGGQVEGSKRDGQPPSNS